MWVKRLILENFRSFYGRHDLHFEKGINSIIGPTGAGKTTIIKAFEYGLFGVTENVTDMEIINDRYKDECRKANKTASASVWMELQHGDKSYLIHREYNSPEEGKTSEHLTVNGGEVENSWIHEYLILPDDFELMNIIGIKLNTLVKSFRSKRSAVRNLIGLPVINRISRATTTAYNEYVSQTKWAKDQESAKVARRELLERELEGIHKRIGQLELDESQVKAELDTAKQRLEETRKEAETEKDSLYTEIEGLQQQHQLISEELENTRKEFEELQENLPYFLVLDKIKERIGEIQKTIGRDANEFFRKYGFLEGRIEALQKYIGKVKPDKDMKDDVENTEVTLQKILNAMPGGKLPSREVLREYMQVERLINFIQYLENLSRKTDQYPILEKTILELSAKEVSLNKRLEDARASFKTRGKTTTEISKLEGNVEYQTRKHASVTTELERLRQDRDIKTREMRDIISDLTKYSKMSEREELYARRSLSLKDLFEDLLQEHEKDKIAKISKRAQDLFLTIIEKPELFTGLELTDDYDVKLHELYIPDGHVPTSRPSTGETDVMYISIALGLNMESGNKMVILDDATINLDSKYNKKVLDAVNAFGFEQVIMICKDTIRDLVLTRLDSKKVYDVQYDRTKQSSILSPILGG